MASFVAAGGASLRSVAVVPRAMPAITDSQLPRRTRVSSRNNSGIDRCLAVRLEAFASPAPMRCRRYSVNAPRLLSGTVRSDAPSGAALLSPVTLTGSAPRSDQRPTGASVPLPSATQARSPHRPAAARGLQPVRSGWERLPDGPPPLSPRRQECTAEHDWKRTCRWAMLLKRGRIGSVGGPAPSSERPD